nr:hypothetical protein BaRGS_014306 [Batillaria attramentaria]
MAHRLLLQELKRDDLKPFQNLQALVITHTLLSSVEQDAFADLKGLRSLDLSFNQIDKMEPGMFQALSSLRFLHLTGNQHRFLPAQLFKGLKDLLELYLGSLRLAAITPDLFTGLDGLWMLDLSDNDLDEIPVEFASGTVFSQLKVLDLSFNRLTELPGALEPLLHDVGRIILEDNPWHCSCGLAWLKSHPEHIYSEHGTNAVVCATPPELRYEILAKVPDDRLSCIPPTIACQDPGPVEAGETLTVTCEATGDPFPNVTWSAADGSVFRGEGDAGMGVKVNRSGSVVELVVQASLAWNGTLRVACSNQKGANHTDVHVIVYPITTTTTTTTTTTPTTGTTPTAATATPSSPAPHNPSKGPPTTTSQHHQQPQTSPPDPAAAQKTSKDKTDDSDLQTIALFVALGVAALALVCTALVAYVVYKTLRVGNYKVQPRVEGTSHNANVNSNAAPTTPRMVAPATSSQGGDCLMSAWNDF